MGQRRFGPWMKCAPAEPTVAFCGVDNVLARASLKVAGSGLVVEAGLGGGPQPFRNIALHAFPGARTAWEVWPSSPHGAVPDLSALPAYASHVEAGMDPCGLAQLASRTVGVPFVRVVAACPALGEKLRRLHGASSL